eukprot:jgi/Botrbrau1/9982/Bobra.0012s0073.1
MAGEDAEGCWDDYIAEKERLVHDILQDTPDDIQDDFTPLPGTSGGAPGRGDGRGEPGVGVTPRRNPTGSPTVCGHAEWQYLAAAAVRTVAAALFGLANEAPGAGGGERPTSAILQAFGERGSEKARRKAAQYVIQAYLPGAGQGTLLSASRGAVRWPLGGLALIFAAQLGLYCTSAAVEPDLATAYIRLLDLVLLLDVQAASVPPSSSDVGSKRDLQPALLISDLMTCLLEEGLLEARRQPPEALRPLLRVILRPLPDSAALFFCCKALWGLSHGKAGIWQRARMDRERRREGVQVLAAESAPPSFY